MTDVTLTPKKQAKILRQIDALRSRAERLEKENRNYDRNAQERGKDVERLRAALAEIAAASHRGNWRQIAKDALEAK